MMAGMARKVPTLAQRLGFTREDGEKSLFACYMITRDQDRAAYIHEVALDLARFCALSLQDATIALCMAETGQLGRLRKLGFGGLDGDYLDTVGAATKGQAAAYAKTYSGSAEVLRTIRV